MIHTDSAAKDNPTNARESDLRVLLGAVDTAARAAKIGDNLRKLLLDAVSQSNVALAPAIDPRSTWAVVVSPSGSAFRPNAAGTSTGVSADVGNRAAYVLRVLSRRQRAAFITQLCRDPQPLVRMLGDRLRSASPNLVAGTAPYFETARSAVERIEIAQQQAIDTVLGSDVLDRIDVIHNYFQHRLAPSTRERHSAKGESGIILIEESDLFHDLSQDPSFADFTCEMPRLITDAALALYRAIAPVIRPQKAKVSGYPSDEDVARDLGKFLHLVCCLSDALATLFPCFVSGPVGELETCCRYRVVSSAAKALYLDFLFGRFPMLLKPGNDDSARLNVAKGFRGARAIAERANQRLQDPSIIPGAPDRIERFRLASANQVQHLWRFTIWLENMVRISGFLDFKKSKKLKRAEFKRSLDAQGWLQATSIVGHTNGTVDVTSTNNVPKVSHGIVNVHSVMELLPARPVLVCKGCAWCHVPNGKPVSDGCNFISPAEVVGRNHPLARITERIALLGDVTHFFAHHLQRRIDWLEAAQATGQPLRTVLYNDVAADLAVAFNLFSTEEAKELNLDCRLVSMSGKYRCVYNPLVGLQVDLPHDATGKLLPPEKLLMEILDEDDRGGGEEEPPPVAPIGHRQSTWRPIAGAFGAGRR
jgi:hypothetical protein